jgi:glycosyltransferase involved in cell wall biosynthesis
MSVYTSKSMDDSPSAYKARFDKLNACVLIPTYNNSKTLGRVIEGVLHYASHIYVINDGSTDATSDVLRQFEGQLTVITHVRNRGKGRALRTGFKQCIQDGFRYALTIDSDGQHYPDDIPLFVEAMESNPDALIMGARNMAQEGVPQKSSFGNKFSNFWYWVETGIKLPDTQTGYRVYPLKRLKYIPLWTNKFELEIEVIVKLAWFGAKVLAVPVKVKYDPNERVSHFRPFRDFTRISILNTFLVLFALIFRPIMLIRKLFSKEFWQNFLEEIIQSKESSARKASAIAVGVFMGIFPAWGFQMAIALGLAVLFRLNKFIVLVASNISIPPMIPFIIYGSYQMGSLVMDKPEHITFSDGITVEDIYINFSQYLIGAILLSIVAGLVAFVVSFVLFRRFRSR